MLIFEEIQYSRFAHDQIIALFSRLSDEDIRLRFAHPVSREYVDDYVDNIFDGMLSGNRVIYGAFNLHMMPEDLVGIIEVTKIGNNAAEIALVVDENFRGMKIGSTLLQKAMAWISNRYIDKVYSLCLTENSPMMKLVRKNGFTITSSYGESEAIKVPLSPTFFSISKEMEAKFYGMTGLLTDLGKTNWIEFWKNFYGGNNGITKDKK